MIAEAAAPPPSRASHRLDPWFPLAFHRERERSATGELVWGAVVLLTNRRCPWRCVMCDLWRNTLSEQVPDGAIVEQIDYALERLAPAQQIKLYNSGSFFDAGAVPPGEDAAVAARLNRYDRVIVESHPLLVGERAFRLRDRLPGTLEIAMGMETAHPEVLRRLNKGLTLEQFDVAAEQLRREGIDLRVFLLIQPPFLSPDQAPEWLAHSIRHAFDVGATAVSLIPTRGGTEPMERLRAAGLFSPPSLKTIEEAGTAGVALRRGRVFVDLWDLERFASCPHCFAARRNRLEAINWQQETSAAVSCGVCEASS